MTARAMDNFGLSRLYLVNPRDEWPNNKAKKSAKHAESVIKNVKIFSNLEEATSQFNLVIATTNRQRFLTKKKFYNFNNLSKKFNDFKKIAILFGPENSGLSNEDLRLSDLIFSINTNNTSNSLNLSHAVAIISHNIFEMRNSNKLNNKSKKINYVNKEQLSKYFDYLFDNLSSKNFFVPKEKTKSMKNNIYNIYLKSQLTKKELQTLWGVTKKLIK